MKKAIFALIVLATMLVAGCTTTEQPNGATGFIGGQSGIDLAFYAGAPPETTADKGEQDFDVIVELTNKGEYAVEPSQAYVKLSGFPPEAFSVTQAELVKAPTETLAKNIKSAEGGIINSPTVSVEFTGFNYKDVEVASRDFPIRAEVCYEYQTTAAAELCIKENFNSNKADDVCQVTAARDFSTSGAPVQITSLAQTTAGADKTMFTFKIQNMDTGRIYKTDSECEDGTANEKKVFVKISGLASEGDTVKCIGLTGGTPDAGYVTLNTGEIKEISCTFTVFNRNNRMEPFLIDLSYAYQEFVDTTITVQHTLE